MTAMDEEPSLTLTWTESRILQVMQAVVSGIAAILNLLYLFVIKANGERLNATEVLQTCKTFLILATLLVIMPLQIIIVNGIEQTNICICLLKDVMEKLLLDAYPFAIMAIAITRFRVSVCRGNSAILVTNTSAIVTFVLCLLPTFISGSFMLFLYFYNNVYQIDSRNAHPKEPVVNECRVDIMVRTYHGVVFIAFGVIPVLVTISIYYLIYHKVFHQRSKSNNALIARRRCKSTAYSMREYKIKASMILLITVFPLAWFLYTFLEVLNIYCPVKLVSLCLILWKPFLFAIHPLAEGLLLQQNRYKIVRCFAKYNVCIQGERRNDTSGDDVLIVSPGIRPSRFGPSPSSVKKENVETISLSSNFQRRYSTLSINQDVELKEEVLKESIAPLTCLHTRRTGHPISMLYFTDVNAEETEVENASDSTLIHVHNCFSHRRDSHSISPYRLRCASVNTSSFIGDKIGVELSTKTFQNPQSCLKSSKLNQSADCFDKLTSFGSSYLRKDVSSCACLPTRDSVDVKFSPLLKKTFDNQAFEIKQLPNQISAHF